MGAVAISEEIGGFVETNAMELALRDFGFEQIPDDTSDVFAGGDLAGEFGHFIVQVAMIHALRDFAFEDFFQNFEIEHHAGDWIGFACNGYFECVIVAVAMGIVAFSEDAAILFRREVRIVVEVRS